MQGGKAQALAAWAAAHDVAMLRMDYSGCGESEGAFEDGTLDIWRDDVLAVLAAAKVGPIILIGSSMGGWLMLLVAERLGDQVAAMVGIAAAPDFTDWDFDAADRATIAATGRIERMVMTPCLSPKIFGNRGKPIYGWRGRLPLIAPCG